MEKTFDKKDAKVAIEKVKSDDYEGINEALIKAIEDIGGIDDVIKPGFKVLIKPNMVAVPTSRLSGAVTRVELAEAVCELVKRHGATPFVAESASVAYICIRSVVSRIPPK